MSARLNNKCLSVDGVLHLFNRYLMNSYYMELAQIKSLQKILNVLYIDRGVLAGICDLWNLWRAF